MAEFPGFTGPGALFLPGFHISPLPGQCINSQPWLRALTHCLRAGAWRSAPLLPWRVQCPGCVCAALAPGSGGSGRYLVSCLPRFPLPAPRVLRCVWRAVPFGCPLPSLAGTPFNAVCAFRGLGRIALLVFPACPLCVCALALPRRPPPPPPMVGVARAPRALRCCALVGPFHAVRAPPRVLPWSRASFGLLGGGGGPVPFPPYLAWGCALPVGWVCASGAFLRRGVGWGGGEPVRRALQLCGRGGQWGGGSPCLGPSLCLPSAGNKAGVTGVALAIEGVAPIRLRLVLTCRLQARSVWRPGALARVCLFFVIPAGAAGWGVGAGPAPASLSGAAVLPGGGGIIPSASGGGGWRPRGLRASGGGGGDRGGGRAVAPLLSLSGGGLRLRTQPPFRRQRNPPWRTRSVGVAGQPRAPGAACRRQACLVEGGREGPQTAPPEAPTDPALPSALPEQAPLRASLAMLWSWGARPPDCSGSPSRAAPGRGLCVVLARWCGLARRRRPPQKQAGSAGARGVRIQLPPPPGVAVLLGGRGDVPSAPGGRRAGAPAARRPGGERGGGRGGGRAALLLPAPLPHGVARGPRPCHPSSPTRPPGVYTCSRGCRAAVGARPGPVGRQWVSVAGGGGGIASPRSAPPPSPGRPQGGLLRLRLPGCRSSVGRQRVMRECAGDQLGALGARPRVPRLQCHPLGCSCPPGGVRGRCLSGRPPAVHGLGRGGDWGGSPGPLTPPPDGRGGAAWWFWPWGASRRLEGRTLPLPPSTLWKPEPRAGPRSVPLLPWQSPRGAGWLGGGGGLVRAGGDGSGQQSGVSGLRGSGPPLALVAPVLPPTGGGAPPSRCTVGGPWVGGPGSAGGGVPRHCPHPTLPRPSSGLTGRCRHLRCRLSGGWGCGGGRFRRR